jgi:hypothetical protein
MLSARARIRGAGRRETWGVSATRTGYFGDVNIRIRSLIFLVVGVLLWVTGALLIIFTEPLELRVFGLVLFAAGPALVYLASRLVRNLR